MNWIGVHVDGLLAVYAGLVIVAVGLLTLRQALRRSSKPPKPARKSGALRAGKRSGQGLFHAATVEQTCQGVGGCMAFELRVQMRLAQPARKSGALRAGKRSGQGLFHAATVEHTTTPYWPDCRRCRGSAMACRNPNRAAASCQAVGAESGSADAWIQFVVWCSKA